MKRVRLIKLFKKLHKWPSIIITLFAILFAASGIIMNHRQLFSSVDISRKILPSSYTYKNWNLAAVRGSVAIDGENSLMYGNIGIWKTNDDYKTFDDFNQGFPEGVDNRKVYSVVKFRNSLFAGTHHGLFKRDVYRGEWKKLKLSVQKDRIADLALKNDTLLVLTRHYLLKSSNGVDFQTVQLPETVAYERKTGLFNTFWELHSGELLGLPGKLIVDLLGLITIFLALTGLLHFFFPKIIRRKKKKEKKVADLVTIKNKNLRWHNVVGYVFVAFLIINTFSGMHLRPPLLIAIANKQVGIIPGTHLDSPNPWFDKLRRVYWDDSTKRYIFSTSEGLFFADETLTKKLLPAPSQPPISIMGCNVFKSLGEQNYLVGSFSGMFLWNAESGFVSDFFTRQTYVAPKGMARPIAENMVAGLIEGKKGAFWFDFNKGVQRIASFGAMPSFPAMPDEIQAKSPMPLWNVSLEIHTGRIFENVLGPFYILYVPLAGICILLVLISGFFVWWMVYRKKGIKRTR